MTHELESSDLESHLAWRWLRQQLAAELGINFRTGGRPRALDADVELTIVITVTTAPRGHRMPLYESLAEHYGVSFATIQRTVYRACREGIAVR